MSDTLKHECGIGLVRLLKPLSYYEKKYGNALWGMNRLYLLMEKQHNRGQDGAGLASLKINHDAGHPYLKSYKSNESTPLKDVYNKITSELNEYQKKFPDKLHDEVTLRNEFSFSGDILMGHVRYGTHGKNSLDTCHPFERSNNWKTKNLILSGNFNLTNVDEIIEMLVETGQHPKDKTDTVTVLENLGYYLDEENDRLFHKYKNEGVPPRDISGLIAEEMDVLQILKNATKRWDGGYVMQGIIGHGDAFVIKDRNGIRPAYFYQDDEIVVVASEKAAIETVFTINSEDIRELEAAHALIIKRNGTIQYEKYTEQGEITPCSFERIYFSRGSAKDIYIERKNLGKYLIPQVLKSIENDLKNTVFSYIPNTAESAFMGMVEGLDEYLNKWKEEEIIKLHEKNEIEHNKVSDILQTRIRVEKAAIKDVKLRTFIADDAHRGDLVAHVYDTTHGILKKHVDNLVVIDDSIVRGTTLRDSIIRILTRLNPKKIIIVSSAPQIRFPDCYGIDMSRLDELVAFNATVQLLKENGEDSILSDIYEKCKGSVGKKNTINHVLEMYKSFSAEEISEKIAELVTADDIKIPVEVIFQKIENLHLACPHHKGDWYFTGKFPTKGGNKVANMAFINFFEGKKERAY
jgi:amidophosphoribosyltransferase